MQQITGSFTPPRWRPTQWLTRTRAKVSSDIHQALMASLFENPLIFIAVVLNTPLTAAAIAWHLHQTALYVWLGFEIAICVVRIAVLMSARMRARAQLPTPTDLYLVLSVIWAAILGIGIYLTLTLGDWPTTLLICLSSAGTISVTCLRNFGAPRLTVLMIALVLGPFCCGALAKHETLPLLAMIQLPLFVSGMAITTYRIHATVMSTMESERKYAQLAHQDVLTGLLNRRRLIAEIRALIKQAPTSSRATLLYLDLDDFKNVNDRYGHGCGDALLKQVAERIRQTAPSHVMASRIGGDEFVILLDDHDDSALSLAQRLLQSIGAPYQIADAGEIKISTSIGIARIPPDAHSAAAALKLADRALYAAKARGKDGFHVDGTMLHFPRSPFAPI